MSSKYSLVLNPDTILEKNALNNFFETAKQYPDFWLIGPSNHQAINFSSREEKVFEVDNIKGFAIFINMEKFEKFSLIKKYFLYFEEIDLCKEIEINNGKIYIDQGIKNFSRRRKFSGFKTKR